MSFLDEDSTRKIIACNNLDKDYKKKLESRNVEVKDAKEEESE